MKLCFMRLILASALFGGACGRSLLQAEDLGAGEIVEATRAAIRRIDSVQGTFRVYFDGLKANGMIQGADGLGMLAEFRWGFESRSTREYMEGRLGFEQKGNMYYQDVQFAYDGKELRTWNKADRSGKICEVADHFLVWESPSILWGRFLTGLPTRNLDELLEGAVLAQIPGTPAKLRVLRNDFKCGLEDRQLSVWVNPDHGFLPDRIEVVKTATRTIDRLIEVQEFYKTSAGVWIPTQGQDTKYAVLNDVELPNGMTREDLLKRSREEIESILSKAKFKTKKLGYGTETVALDTKDLAVNTPIRDERFTFEFPKGTPITAVVSRARIFGISEVTKTRERREASRGSRGRQ